MMRNYITGWGCALLLGAPALADSVTFDASQGNLAATATFATSGSNLIVTLENSSQDDVLVPADVLTALFFDSGTPLTLTRSSAFLRAGDLVLFSGTTDAGGGVGGEWAYKSGLSGAPLGASYGISSTGLDLFGPPDLFPGTNLFGPTSPDGLQYGLVSAGDNPSTGNTPVTGSQPLIKNGVVFTLSGLPNGYSVNSINNVSFQYGTSLDEPNIPEPGSLMLLCGGMALSLLRKR